MRDGHVHSQYCPHGSNDTFEQYIDKAIEVGLREITFTEHFALPKNFNDPSLYNDSAMREEDMVKYFKEVTAIKEKYKNKIKINRGIEVDYLEGYEEDIKNMLNKYGEYIDDSIISVHMIRIDEQYYLIDYNVEEFQKVINKLGSLEAVYNKYYETVKLLIQSDLGEYKPKRIGHLNLVRKFNKVFPYDYSENKKLEEVVKLIKLKEYELDFNISGLRKEHCKEPYIHGNLLELVKKYKIPMVLGTDSHKSDEIESILKSTSSI